MALFERAQVRGLGRHLGLLACGGIGLLTSITVPAATDSSMAGPEVVCNVTNVEDLIRIGDTKWVLGSSLHGGANPTATLYVFDMEAGTGEPVDASSIAVRQDPASYPECAAAPDLAHFGSHGLDYRGDAGGGRLYVVNHAGRESIEAFTVDMGSGKPTLEWNGCVVAPKTAWPDGIVSLPDGGMLVTSLWDPNDPGFIDKLVAGAPVGGLLEWHPGKGWSSVGPSDLSGPNGVIVSADGETAYVALWAEKRIMSMNRSDGVVKKVDVSFLPDNLRWSEDGSFIIAGGQDTTIRSALDDCFTTQKVNCDIPGVIVRVDPETLETQELVASAVHQGMGSTTGAIQVGDDLLLATFRADRIVRIKDVFAR